MTSLAPVTNAFSKQFVSFLAITSTLVFSSTKPDSSTAERVKSFAASLPLCRSLPSIFGPICVAVTTASSFYAEKIDSHCQYEPVRFFKQKSTEVLQGIGTGTASTFISMASLLPMVYYKMNSNRANIMAFIIFTSGSFATNEVVRRYSQTPLLSLQNVATQITTFLIIKKILTRKK
ncbi:MAG: hypothetical protein S4CHLAM6_12350 [Chlamydiae bacterium]|nr:hypothetical protein [Chlamydiota bacterium]